MNRAEYRKKARRAELFKRFFRLFLVALSAAVTMFVFLRIYAQMTGAPSLAVPKATVFLDEHSQPIGDKFAGERRYWISLQEMSPYLADAIVSVEDQEFYSHHGFDFTRIAAALLKDAKAMRKVEGASTITQQYARNLFLTHDKTWTRKIKEALYAYRMEVFYDKDTILEGYLNTVYFGHGMYGVEAASNYFFGKSAHDLTLAESAMLVGIPKGPSSFSPLVNEKKAVNRQQLILREMEEEHFITKKQKERAATETLVYKNDEWQEKHVTSPFFLDEAWREADTILAKSGRRLEEGGWTIKTTMNTFHQQVAEEVVEQYMPANKLEVAFISMNPASGAITAIVGGKSYKDSTFNRATMAKRQPGSAIKPLLFGGALEEGYTPLTFMKSEHTIFTYDDGRREYEPKNVNGQFANHPISLAQALAISDNIYAVKTIETIGYKPLKKWAKKLGVHMAIQDTPSMALGTAEVTLKELTAAYNQLASTGIERKPTTILSIKDADGNVVYEKDPAKSDKRILPEKETFVLTHMMTGMFDPVFNDYTPSTGLAIRSKQTRPYAGKSGTTNSDQWMLGFSPTLTAGVWNGYDSGETLTHAADKLVTKSIWIDFMEKVHAGQAARPFIPPKGVKAAVIDIETGGIAVSSCTKQRLMYLKEEDIPKRLCTDPDVLEEGPLKQTNDLFPFSWFTGGKD
ncbi:transglycosylase domain-containing protein [Paenisporosarcina cavernae]|uniref:PBP1A family penicillin-binding protein n=1 Tax=Paenisporosarcina cavernae TaxID=2320858 RepID=A0A385YQW6_9BACL|nr:PBP1A family penicillin-binding protein [Paenisporosarcina cavernae]AYC28790.1 PBP1A family penicillin-binding protein [Paenisporosarcina cavernae]